MEDVEGTSGYATKVGKFLSHMSARVGTINPSSRLFVAEVGRHSVLRMLISLDAGV